MFGREWTRDSGNAADSPAATRVVGSTSYLGSAGSRRAGSSLCGESILSILLSGQNEGQGLLIGFAV